MAELHYTTAGESHGQGLIVIIDGVPAGLKIRETDLIQSLVARQTGYGRGARMAIERDHPEWITGLRHGHTLGGPIGVTLPNRDWENWRKIMSPFTKTATQPINIPRPGHADLAGCQKYGFRDCREVIERASARETAARVLAGAIASKFLQKIGIQVASYITRLGPIAFSPPPEGTGAREIRDWAGANPDFKSGDSTVFKHARGTIDKLRKLGDTIGGAIAIVADGLPPGLGSYVQPHRRLDARLAGALTSIPSVRGFLIGDIASSHRLPGSHSRDEPIADEGSIRRLANHGGGLEGGMTNGETLRLEIWQKPLPTQKIGHSLDFATGEQVPTRYERSDTCALSALAVIAEYSVAFELAAVALAEHGGNSWADFKKNFTNYKKRIRNFLCVNSDR